MMIHPCRLLPFVVLLAACGSEPSTDAAGRAAPADSAPATVAAGPADTAPAASGARRTERPLTLASDGLELAGGGAPRRLTFGTGRTRVLAEVGGVLGEPREQGTMDECPAGPMDQVQYAGLQLNFRDSAFVGWFAGEGSTLRTAPGVGPGSTLGQLKAAYPGTTVEETSLGYEFTAGELYGIVTDTTDAGVVQVVFAGINCIFR